MTTKRGGSIYFAATLLVALCLTHTHARDADKLELYPAYGDVRGTVVEGRVVELQTVKAPAASDSWWTNLYRSFRALVNDERDGVAVVVTVAGRDHTARTDDEGYFRVDVRGPLAPGWHKVTVRSADRAGEGSLLIVPERNTLGVISDLDDTIQVSQVTERRRLLKNTFLKNPHQREAVPGTAEFYRSLVARNPEPETAPMIYLSASPRQLQGLIQSFLELNRFPRGVLITKKVTNDDTGEPMVDQMAYKAAKLEELLARLPHVRFVLVGDDGERDPEIYHAVRTRHPTRVEGVYIRRVHNDPARAVFPGQVDLTQTLRASR